MDDPQTTFAEQVDSWVSSRVQAGMQDFSDLLLNLPGVYPVDVLASLRRLTAVGIIDRTVLAKATVYINEEGDPDQCRRDPPMPPVPHPLDYTWRFGRAAVSALKGHCESLSARSAMIVLLGAPSVLWYAPMLPWRSRFALIDSDPLVRTFLGLRSPGNLIFCRDLSTDELPNIKASLVISDAPWYADYTRLFMRIAGQLCHLGGYVLVSFPNLGTRPGIAQEWLDLVRWASADGLSLVDDVKDVLPYVSPPFERSALAASGIRRVPREWRRANLGVFRREREMSALRPLRLRARQEWHEVVLGDVRVRIRPDTQLIFRDPSLVSIVPGDVLPTVSRRDSRRAKADVWTSCNRIFTCQGRCMLGTIMRALDEDVAPRHAVEKALGRKLVRKERCLVARACRQIVAMGETERLELQKYW